MENTPFLFTSECVTEGHPDKICDQISDAVLDAYLEQDEYSRCAVECMVTENRLFIAGEISSNVRLDHKAIAREVIADIGYTDPVLGFYDGCRIDDTIHNQTEELWKNEGAGDQGIVFGYACNQTEELMPLPIFLARELTTRLAEVRKTMTTMEELFPDGKSQVTVNYINGKPVSIDKIVVFAQHSQLYGFNKLHEDIIKYVVNSVITEDMLKETSIQINPIGRW